MRYVTLLAAAAAFLVPGTPLRADPLTLEQPSAYRQAAYTAADGERACRAQARAQRLDVVRIVSRTVNRAGPVPIGSTIVMEIRRAGRLMNATCEHVRRTNVATISLPAPPTVVSPDYNAAERACGAQARSQGLTLVRVTSRAAIRIGPSVTGARLGVDLRRGSGPVFNGSCDWTIRTNSAQLTFTEPRPPAPPGPDYAAAERACGAQARREGLTQVRVTSRAPIRRGVALVGARLGVELRRGTGRAFTGSCDWTIRTGQAVLSYTEPRPPIVVPVPDYAAAERACNAQARREGLTPVRFTSPREPIRRGPTLIGARLGMELRRGSGRAFPATCEWTIRTGQAVLSYTAPRPPVPPVPPPMSDAAAIDLATRACTAHFAATPHPVSSVRHQRLARDGAGRLTEALIDVLRSGMPFREDFFRCTYNFQTRSITVRQLPR